MQFLDPARAWINGLMSPAMPAADNIPRFVNPDGTLGVPGTPGLRPETPEEMTRRLSTPGQSPLGQWWDRNFGYTGSAIDVMTRRPGNMAPPGPLRETANVGADVFNSLLTDPVRAGMQYIGVLPKPTTPPAPAAPPNTYAKDLAKQLSGLAKPGETTLRLPGASAPIGRPNLPEFPSFDTSRNALAATKPEPTKEATKKEQWSGQLGAAAEAAGKGRNVGEVMALAGGAFAQGRAHYLNENRQLADRQQERMRQYNQQVASFEADVAKSKYQADWQKAVMDHQIARENAQLTKPTLQVNDKSIVISQTEGNDRVVRVIPLAAAATATAIGDKTAEGLPGGANLITRMRSTAESFPDQTLGWAVAHAHQLVRSGTLQLPGDTMSSRELKEYAIKGNAALGLPDGLVKNIYEISRSKAAASGLNPGSKEYADRLRTILEVELAQVFLQKPDIYSKVTNSIWGVNR